MTSAAIGVLVSADPDYNSGLYELRRPFEEPDQDIYFYRWPAPYDAAEALFANAGAPPDATVEILVPADPDYDGGAMAALRSWPEPWPPDPAYDPRQPPYDPAEVLFQFVQLSLTDAILATDAAPGVRAFLSLTDVVALTDSITAKNFVAVGDALHLADALSLKGIVALSDVIHLSDGVALVQLIFLTVNDRIRLDDGAQALPKGGRPWYPVDRGGF